MKLIFSILMTFPLALTAQDKFLITGNIKGLPEGSAVSISDANNPADTLAKTTINKGIFELAGKIKEPNVYQLNFDGVRKKSIVFIGNEKLKINGNADALQDLSVSGSAVHDDFEEFKKTFEPLFKEVNLIGQKMGSSPSDKEKDSLNNVYNKNVEKIKSSVDGYITKNPSSPVSPFVILVTSELDQDISQLEKRYAKLDKKIQSGFYGDMIRQKLNNDKAGAIGSQAIEFSQADTEGKQVSLSSFRGKYVLIDFWASWCRPCRDENPNVVKAFNKFKDKNFTVLGISLDRDRAAWLKAIKADKLQWTQLSDLKFWNNDVASLYKVQSIPQNFLIDPKGKIVAKNLRGPGLEETLSQLLK